MNKYKLTLNEEQMQTIAIALEQYSRMICGQLGTNYMPSIEHSLHKEVPDFNTYIQTRNKINEYFDLIKEEIWNLPRGASHGIGYDEKSDLTYDLYKVILHQFELDDMEKCEKENKSYHGNVHSSPPWKHANQPLMKVQKIDPRQTKIERILKDEE